ncbi:MAG: hypothetical protein KF681_08510 [Bdellovibrionaceae bacterium]|nr:hypothetical protein [Pseudobdellovibrionaceae bacterium]
MTESWRTDINPKKRTRDDTMIAAFGPRVFAFSSAAGTVHNRKSATTRDVLVCAHRYLELPEQTLQEEPSPEVREEIAMYASESRYFQKYHVPKVETDNSLSSISAFLLRSIESQHSHQGGTPHSIVRSFAILKNFIARLSAADRNLVDSILGLDQKLFFRSALITWLYMVQKETRGFLYLENLESFAAPIMGSDVSAFGVFISRMSCSRDDATEWLVQCRSAKEELKKYFPLYFYNTPLLNLGNYGFDDRIENRDLSRTMMCPSPGIYLKSATEKCYELVSRNSDRFQVRNPLVVFGEAFEDYVHEALNFKYGHAFVEKVEPVQGQKRADFIVESSEFILVVELKKSLIGLGDRLEASGVPLLKFYERTGGAFDQIGETISVRKLDERGKPVIAIVVSEANNYTAAARFITFFVNSGIRRKMNLHLLDVMTIELFERVFLHREPDEILRDFISRWADFDSNPNGIFAYSTAKSEMRPGEEFAGHLEAHLEELLPTGD